MTSRLCTTWHVVVAYSGPVIAFLVGICCKKIVRNILLLCVVIASAFNYVVIFLYVDYANVKLVNPRSTWNFQSLLPLVFNSTSSATETPPPPQFTYVGRNGSSIFSRIFRFDENGSELGSQFLIETGDLTCFREGTNWIETNRTVGINCHCKPSWYGPSCSIPGIVQRSATQWSKDGLTLRRTSRRIVNAFPLSFEFDMLELRLAELGDVVDIFLILESNYTAYGMPKKLNLLERLHNGTYSDFHFKIVYVLLDFFPPDARKDGWIVDGLSRNHIGTHGLPRIRGLRTDDLFVLTDADEISCREALTFLKWHDGYSEPVLIKYEWYVYGFFWSSQTAEGELRYHELPTVVTVGMVTFIFRNQVYFIRNAISFMEKHKPDVKVSLLFIRCPV